VRRAAEAVHALEQAFFSTPYPTTGLSTAARTIVRLVEELRWLNTVALRDSPRRHVAVNRPACAVKRRAGAVLEHVAELLDAPLRAGDALGALLAAREELREALTELEHATTLELPATVTAPCRPQDDRARVMISSLDPSFRAQELSFVVSQIAENTEYAVAADRRNWRQRWLGRQPQGRSGTVAAARRRAGAHVERNSVWLHNSLRGGTGLALAVLVADLTGVQHAFWVVFGTLSVLRSNALSTGDNVLRALLGTSAGFIVGGVLVSVIGTNETLLWVLLPFVVLLAGLAPAAISYAAGQAAFTLTLLILFNILQPAGLTVGLVRIEDIALGGAVSLVVGVLFWPRGAAGALGRALAEGYANGVSYLAAAVAFGSGRCDASGPTPLTPRAQAQEALAAARRLDEAFRGYLSERGAKPLALAEMTRLVTGVAGVRLAADAILELWQSDPGDGGDRRSARRELLARAALMTGWYDTFAASLSDSVAVPAPMAPDATADEALTEAVGQDLRGTDGEATATGVRVIWTSDHLDAVRRLQDSIVGPARTAAAQHALR
jgi:hypothetical protein